MTRQRGSLPRRGVGTHSAGGARHGLSGQQVASMAAGQRGRCAVCGGPLPATPVVDHDHALAVLHGHDPRVGCRSCVRGLLCGPCNLMLGNARDSADTLRSGALYLERARARAGVA